MDFSRNGSKKTLHQISITITPFGAKEVQQFRILLIRLNWYYGNILTNELKYISRETLRLSTTNMLSKPAYLLVPVSRSSYVHVLVDLSNSLSCIGGL